ncbi:MAG: hemolysin family protein [Actinomycetota bacterium]|nr:hemolysin family protein [Actinomycetota bacterium]
MVPLLTLGAIAVATALAAVLAAEEAASALVSPGRILRLVEAEKPGALALDRLVDRAYRFRAAAAFSLALAYGTGIAMSSWAVRDLYADAPAFVSVSIGVAAGVLVVFSFGQALPRTVAVQNPEGVALAFARVALSLSSLLYPFAKVLGSPWSWGVRLVTGEPPVRPWITEDQYRAGSVGNGEESAREETEEALLEALSDFAEKVVREVMVPRTDMTCVPDTATALEAIEVIEGAGCSRIPVYHETVDDIRGVLYAKDLLAAVARDSTVRPATIARAAYFVPETKPVQELLIEMRLRTHIAIVADEYGGTAGLVTIEDLLEEIVGEIFDEFDLEIRLVSEIGDGRYRVDARLPVDELNELFDTAVVSDSDSVGGVVAEVAGRIPDVGDSVEVEGLRMTVEELEGTRIRQLIVESAGPAADKERDDA